MFSSQEPKYNADDVGRIVNRTTGKPVPDDEPLFIFRAQDRNAVVALQAYKDTCTSPDHRFVVQRRIDDFMRFAAEHPDRMKEPDSNMREVSGVSIAADHDTTTIGDVARQAAINELPRPGPRITKDDVYANIESEHYFTAAEGCFGADTSLVASPQALGLLTFCVLLLRNGFTVTGESACVSPENFNAEVGRRIAHENAVEKIWALMGYELKCRLHAQANGGAIAIG